MNYFQAYLPSLDEAIVAAWDSQVAEAAETPWLTQALAAKSADLFPRFAARYAELRALPRGARRALQRRLARSGELAIPSAGRRKLAGSLAGVALLLALGQEAQALIINVTTNKLNRENDGLCSLVEAIENANDNFATHPDCAAGNGAAEIVLLPGRVHALRESMNSDTSTGLPDITSTITISGNGSTIRRRKNAPKFRILKVTGGGDLTLQNVTIRSGDADSNGGGVLSYGTLKIKHSRISANRSYQGGAVYVGGGTATIENSTIEKNFAYSGGGIAAFNFGALSIVNSTIAGNRSGYHGGGVSVGGGSVTIKNSSITGNRADYPGGGLSVLAGSVLAIDNSTISGNVSRREGGGIFNGAATVTLKSGTISGNRSREGGGGIYNNGSLNLNRSLISGNKAPIAREVYNTTGTVTADNFNMFGAGGDGGIYGFTYGATDIVPAEAIASIVDPLADNGGSTYTHALPDGSPAIDAAPNDADCITTDQRGEQRPGGGSGNCDIGAFEVQ